MYFRRFRSLISVPRLVVLFVVVAVAAGTLAAVNIPSAPRSSSSAGGVLPAGSEGSLGGGHPWWDPFGWFSPGRQAPSSTVVPGTQNAIAYPRHVTRKVKAAPVRRVGELTGKRTEFSRTYALPDGDRQSVISAEPVNYRDASGHWQPIDTAVTASQRPGFVFQDTTNVFGSYFSSDPSRLVRFEVPGGGWLQTGLAGAAHVTPRAHGNVVTYRGILPGVTLSYAVTPAGLKERVVLASASAGAALRFTVTAGGGLVPSALRGGATAWSRNGMPVLVIPAPVMADARGASSRVAAHARWDAGARVLTQVLAPDRRWLGAAGRVFPVTVDPTIEIAPTGSNAQNVMIQQDTPTSNYFGWWQLEAGTTATGAVRSLLSFPLPVPAGTVITSASLNLYWDQSFGPAGGTQTLKAYQATSAWSASTVTWDSVIGGGTASSNQVTDTAGSGNRWDSFSVTGIVQSWLNGTSPDDGFVVKAVNESALGAGGPVYEGAGATSSGVPFYNGATSTDPQLVITYGQPGVTPNPVTVINATGAQLSWPAYTNTSGNPAYDLAEYQVYRSTLQSFTPDPAQTVPDPDTMLLAPVPAGTMSYTDTTATPTPAGATAPNVVYYMVAVKTTGGQILAGPTVRVELPQPGHTTMLFPATGAATLSSAQPTVNLQGATGPHGMPWAETGDNDPAYGITRSVFTFPALSSSGIPADATITDAHVQLWGWQNTGGNGSASYQAQAITQAFTPSQVTWDDAATGTAWTGGGGGTLDTTSTVTPVNGLSDNPARVGLPLAASVVSGWLAGTTPQYGVAVRLSQETGTGAPSETETWLDTAAPESSLAPVLSVTYLDTTPDGTYYAPGTPKTWTSGSAFTTSVTVTNTTATAWDSRWYLTYHWVTPDGTEATTDYGTTGSDQGAVQLTSLLPANTTTLVSGASVTVSNMSVQVPDISSSGNSLAGYTLEWDLYDATDKIWLSSGTATPNLNDTGTGSSIGTLNQAGGVALASGTYNSAYKFGTDMLGLEKYFQYTGIATGSGSVLENNDTTGNVVWNYNPFSNPSNGFQTFVRLDYNSMDTSESSMGFGWSLQASTLTRLGTPLDFHGNYDNPSIVTLTDGNGGTHEFTNCTAATQAAPGSCTSPAGFHYYLQPEYSTCKTANGQEPVDLKAWLITAPDRTQFWFDCRGYQTEVVDKNGNTTYFTYSHTGNSSVPDEYLQYITDPEGRQTLTLTYNQKKQSYTYCDGTTDTSLTNPDVVGQVATITDISGRQLTFQYNEEGELCKITDGAGPGWTGPATAAKTFEFGYDPTQGNKNVKLVSVTDPRGHNTCLYYNQPSNWSLQEVVERRWGSSSGGCPATPGSAGTSSYHPTGFSYTPVPAGDSTYPLLPDGGVDTAVTDGSGHTTSYQMDLGGHTMQVTSPRGYITQLGWDSDDNVTKLTEANGAVTTWSYDQGTGYPLTMQDAANQGTGNEYVYTYQFSLGGHVADLTSELTPQQRLWTFAYDSFGNLKTVTSPDGNVSGAAAGSYTTSYTWWPQGSADPGALETVTDPDGNVTTFPAYDPTGYPLKVTDARGHSTSYAYSPAGRTLEVTDPDGKRVTRQYDVFGRPGTETTQVSASQTVTVAAPVYDGNDNVTTSYAPSYSTTPGPATVYGYDYNDDLTSKALPAESGSGQAAAATWTYNADGTVATAVRPDGNVPGANTAAYTTSYTYWPDAAVETVRDGNGGVTSYGYDNVGNTTSVTDPDNVQTQYSYTPDHQVRQVTDNAGHTTLTGYDADGLVDQTTDASGNTTYYTLDADGQVIQQEVPAQAPGAAETCPASGASSAAPPAGCDVTQYVYDQAGNKTQVLTPQALAHGYSLSSSCVNLPAYTPGKPVTACPYTWVYTYNADNQVGDLQTPAMSEGGYTGGQVTQYYHDDEDRLWQVQAPPSNGSMGVANTTSYTYWDNGWPQSSTDPRGITTSWAYAADGQQATRTIASAGGGDMSRTMTWAYYPDQRLQSVADNGVPTGMYAEVIDNTDTGNATASPAASWTSAACSTGCDGYSYQTDTAGTGSSDTFTWRLNIPGTGTGSSTADYSVYVKYPALPSGSTTTATSGASYTITYANGSGGTTTATVSGINQGQNTGTWVKLGEWAFSPGLAGQQVTLNPGKSTGGTSVVAVANAVKIVADTAGTANTADRTYSYTYDSDGNQTGITQANTSTSPATTLGSDIIGYDNLDRVTSVTEDNGAGAQAHCTGYGYDPASNLTLMTHDVATSALCAGYSAPTGVTPVPQYSSYAYDNLNQLKTETDGTSATDPAPKVTSFTYTPDGQAATELKPNSNLVSWQYYASGQVYTQAECTNNTAPVIPASPLTSNITCGSGGTLVASHAYGYDSDGNQTQDTMQLMSAGTSATLLQHTYYDTYNQLGQLTGVTTNDNSDTESYTHDPAGNVTSQTINGTTTSYSYDRGILQTSATTGQATTDYNYDPLGRLDAITRGGTILQSSSYDGFDNLTSQDYHGTVTSYSYDPLNRLALQTTSGQQTSFSYLGLTSQVAGEQDPGSIVKTYTYTPGGMRIGQTTTGGTNAGTAYYSYNSHGDVQALTSAGTTGTTANGNTTATYGYTAYGGNLAGMFTGADKISTSPGTTTAPDSSYRFNAMRWDPGSGQYDMGFRNYNPGINSFISRDMYNGALADMNLTADPFTGARYAFGDGNPISNIEMDGHMPCMSSGICGGTPYLDRVATTQEIDSISTGFQSNINAINSDINNVLQGVAFNSASSFMGIPTVQRAQRTFSHTSQMYLSELGALSGSPGASATQRAQINELQAAIRAEGSALASVKSSTSGIEAAASAVATAGAAGSLINLAVQEGGLASAGRGDSLEFYHGTSYYAAQETEEAQAFQVDKILARQTAAGTQAEGNIYLTTQPDTARYFADFQYGQGQSGGPAVLKIIVNKNDFLNYAEQNGINVETPIDGMPGMTETTLPVGSAQEFNDIALFMTDEGE
jgi:RHS repeat-associated protein